MEQTKTAQRLPIWMVMLCTLLTLFMGGNVSHAAEIAVDGAGANDAIITDANGNDVTHRTNLNKYEYFEATYHWSLPANKVVQKGDTAKFQLPNNVEVRVADTTFDVTDESGNVVGQFNIAKGSHTGTLTFNDYFATHKITDIHGTLSLKVSGTQENSPSDWFLNKAGWLDSQKQANWTIVYNPHSQNLTNVDIKDTLQNGQTFDMNSIELWYGKVENNQFIPTKKVTNPVEQGLVKVSADQKVLTAHFDRLNTAIQFVYKTKANTNKEQFVLMNTVDATSDQLGSATMTSTLEVGGDAVADGTEQPSQPDKPDCRPDYPHHRPQYPCHGHHHGHHSCRPQYPHHRPCRPQRPIHHGCRPHCSQKHHHYFFNGVVMN